MSTNYVNVMSSQFKLPWESLDDQSLADDVAQVMCFGADIPILR